MFFANIFTKMKKCAKTFSPVYMGPRSNLLTKNDQKSCDTGPLNSVLVGNWKNLILCFVIFS